MAMAFRPFCLNPRTRVGDLQVLSASKRPKYPDASVQIFFNPKIPFVNRDGYLTKSSVHKFESIAKNLTPVGLERIVVHVHWGAVERDGRQYHWAGYQELLSLARSFDLKVKVVLGFHHHYWEGIEIPLPKWVMKEMQKNRMHFSNRVGDKSSEYISFACDDLRLLEGRSPAEVYSDLMESFVNTFSSLLGYTITDIEIGLGPNGELRFPYLVDRCRDSFSMAKSDFACFDRHMLKGAYRREILRSMDAKDPHAREVFLKWYSKVLRVHGDKLLQKAMLIFSKSSVNVTARLAPMYWGPYTVRDCELVAGYCDYAGIMEMLDKNKCGICIPCFDVKENASWVKMVIEAAGEFQVPIVGEKSKIAYDQKSFKQIMATTKLCKAKIQRPFSFNLGVDEHFQYSWDRFSTFYDFVESMTQYSD